MARPAEPLISAPDPWRHLPGHLHGLPQPGLVGHWQIRTFAPGLLQRVDALLLPLIGPLPTDLQDSARPGRLQADAVAQALALARRLLHGLAACQRDSGIAVSGRHHLSVAPAVARGTTCLAVAAPAPDGAAAARVLRHLMKAVNGCDSESVDEQAMADGWRHLQADLRRLAEPGQNTGYLLQAALDLDVPFTRIARRTYRFGQGCHQQVMNSTSTERTPSLATLLAKDKMATAALLRRSGLPGAEHLLVRDADQAVAAARRLGYPVVVKPMDLDEGKGVWADLRDDATLREAFAVASALSPNVLVERHVAGTGHRLTLAGGRVIKVTAKHPWGVPGDGIRSIESLVEADLAARSAAAPDPHLRREIPSLDAEALGLLRQQQLTPASVPEAGCFVVLRRRNNATTGGTTLNLDPASVHADNIELALRAAEVLMLDISGVDLIVPDIGRSWMEQVSLICEVNAMPQSDAKTLRTVLQDLMAAGCRVPVTLLLVPDDSAVTSDAQAAALLAAAGANGLSSRSGIWIEGRRAAPAQANGYEAADALLGSRRLRQAAVLMGFDEVLRYGLPADRVQQVIVARDVAALLGAANAPSAPRPATDLQSHFAQASASWSAPERQRLMALVGPLAPHLLAP